MFGYVRFTGFNQKFRWKFSFRFPKIFCFSDVLQGMPSGYQNYKHYICGDAHSVSTFTHYKKLVFLGNFIFLPQVLSILIVQNDSFFYLWQFVVLLEKNSLKTKICPIKKLHLLQFYLKNLPAKELFQLCKINHFIL